jgi:hypothetical protein
LWGEGVEGIKGFIAMVGYKWEAKGEFSVSPGFLKRHLLLFGWHKK